MVEDAKNRGLRSKFIDEYDLRCFYDRWDITVSDCRSYINELTDLYQTVYGPLDVKRRK